MSLLPAQTASTNLDHERFDCEVELSSEEVDATLKHGITCTSGQEQDHAELLLRGRATETRAESAVQHVWQAISLNEDWLPVLGLHVHGLQV